MAQFYKPGKKNKSQTAKIVQLDVEKLDHQGRGLGFVDGRATFVAGALPEERVKVRLTEVRKQYAIAQLLSVEKASQQRIKPACPYFGYCGGCQLQYLDNSEQVRHKQATLHDLYLRAGIQVEHMAPAIVSHDWHYRRALRLAVRVNRKTRQLEVGLRKPASQDICTIDHCAVLHPDLDALIPSLKALLESIRDKQGLGHLELFRVDTGIILLLRLTKGLDKADQQRLRDYVQQHNSTIPMALFLQPSPECIEWFAGTEQAPAYQLQREEQTPLILKFSPSDFLQVNSKVNQAMVIQAMEWLDVQPGERVLDLFSGIGNFTLPLALQAGSVVAIEGVASMTRRCQQNAALNHLENIECFSTDLSQDFTEESWAQQGFDKVLLDPARAGAAGVIPYLAKMQARSIVYVACDAATMARDAASLCQHGYQLKRLGLVDMFPQTAHLESMALFVPR